MIMIAPSREQKPAKRDAAWWTEWNLENWARHETAIDLPEGAPSEACGGIEGYTSLDLDNELAYDRMTVELAQQTGLVIAALPEAEKNAIRHRYLPNVQFDFWRHTSAFGVALASAKELVQQGLRRRAIYLGD